MGRFTFKPKSFFSSGLDIYEGRAQIGRILHIGWKAKISYVLEGQSYTIQPDEDLRGAYVLLRKNEESTTVVTRAEALGMFSSGLRIVHPYGVLVLKSNGILRRKCVLTVDGDPQGTVRLDGFFGQSGNSELPDGLARPLQIFLIALAFCMWKEDDAAA